MTEIRLYSYGADMKSAAIDAQTLLACDRLISSTREERAALGRADLMALLLQTCYLAETVCLHDIVVIPEYDTDARRTERVLYHELSRTAMDTELARNLMSEGVLAPLKVLTIDDIQFSRLFEKWDRTTMLLGRTLSKRELNPPSQEQYELLLAGLLAEELTGTPYFPAIDLLPFYLPTSGLIADMQAYSLLLETYLKMRQGEAARARIRASLGAIREVSLPPIMTLVLSRVNDLRDLVPVLLEVRHELSPLREKTGALADLAKSEAPPEKWEKELTKLQEAINDIAASYGGHPGGRRALSILSVSDIAGQIKDDSAPGGPSAEGAVQLSVGKLLSLGLNVVSSAIRRRRIRPLPMFQRTLAQLSPITDKVAKILGLEFTLRDFRTLEHLAKPYEDLWRHVAKITSARKTEPIRYAAPDPADHRKGDDALQYIQWVDFGFLLRAFNITSRAKYDPTYERSDYLLDIGFVLLSHKRPTSAIRAFQDVTRDFPDIAEGYYGLCVAYRDLGDLEKAKKCLARALSLGPVTSEMLNDLGSILMAEGEWQQAADHLKRALEMEPENIPATCNLSTCLRKAGDVENAVHVLERPIAAGVPDHRLFECMGHARLETVEYRLAKEAFLRSTEEAADVSSAWLGLGKAQDSLGERDEAEASFQQALRHAHGDDERRNALGQWASFLLSGGDVQSAAETLPDLIRLDPDNPRLQHVLGASLFDSGRHEEAEAPLREAVRRDPKNVDAGVLLATLQLELQKPQDAKATLESLRESASSSPEIHVLLAKVNLQIGQVQAAVESFENAMQVGFKQEELMYNAAVKLDRMHEYHAAIRLYRLELRINPDFAECLANLAADLSEIGRPKEALECARAAVRLSPGDPVNLNTLVVACYLSSDSNGAAAACRRLLALPRKEGDEHYRRQAESILDEQCTRIGANKGMESDE